MKREIEAERFGPAAPCAPYGICKDPSGHTRAARLRGVGSLSSAAPPADGHEGGTVFHHSAALRPRLFYKKA